MHTQKAKPVQSVSVTIVHTKSKKHTKKPNNLKTYIHTTALIQIQDTLMVTKTESQKDFGFEPLMMICNGIEFHKKTVLTMKEY